MCSVHTWNWQANYVLCTKRQTKTNKPDADQAGMTNGVCSVYTHTQMGVTSQYPVPLHPQFDPSTPSHKKSQNKQTNNLIHHKQTNIVDDVDGYFHKYIRLLQTDWNDGLAASALVKSKGGPVPGFRQISEKPENW